MARAHVDPQAWAKKHRIRMIISITASIILLVTVGTFLLLKKVILPAQHNRECYTKAEAALDQGRIQEAIDFFSLVWQYEDSFARATELAYSQQPDNSFRQLIQDAKLGDIIRLGSWEQDGVLANGAEPIEWFVLAEDEGRLLLWSKYVLDARPFNETKQDVTWADCSLRAWLLEDFYPNAFSETEKALIPMTVVETADNPASGTKGGENTEDHVFILSFNELRAGILCNPALESITAKPTTYAESHGVDISGEGRRSPWWLRMPGIDQSSAGYCDASGNPLYSFGVNHTGFGVRPAIWVFAPGRAVSPQK